MWPAIQHAANMQSLSAQKERKLDSRGVDKTSSVGRDKLAKSTKTQDKRSDKKRERRSGQKQPTSTSLVPSEEVKQSLDSQQEAPNPNQFNLEGDMTMQSPITKQRAKKRPKFKKDRGNDDKIAPLDSQKKSRKKKLTNSQTQSNSPVKGVDRHKKGEHKLQSKSKAQQPYRQAQQESKVRMMSLRTELARQMVEFNKTQC